MLELKNRIESAKAAVQRATTAKTVAETQKETAEQQLKEVVEKMAAAGVTPENINTEIVRLEEKLQADVAKVERLIPQDI